MKKVSSIITLCVYALLLCSVFFHYSCSRDHTDCSRCQITPQEEALLCYKQGDIAFFKNDMTSVYDTLHVTSKGPMPSGCSDPCRNTYGSISANISFSPVYLSGCDVDMAHNSTAPAISYSNPYGAYFPQSGSLQTMTINSIAYNDLYVTSIDSTKISAGFRNSVPWKIAYSKSKGFVRFYMTNRQTWSKL